MIKELKVLKKKTVQNTWEKVGESIDFAENGNFIRISSKREYILKITVLKKLVPCSCSKFLQNIRKPI